MSSLIIALLVGMTLGYLNIVPEKIYKITDKLIYAILFVLLFTLAVGIGSDQEIFNHLDTLGIKALALAMGSVVGSVFFLWIVQKKLFGGEHK